MLSFTACWGFVWLLLLEVGPDEEHNTKTPAGPGGPIFGLVIIELSGLFAGMAMRCLGLPALLGPLVLGIFLRNVEAINVFNNFKDWEYRDCKKYDIKCEDEASKSSGHWIKPIRYILLNWPVIYIKQSFFLQRNSPDNDSHQGRIGIKSEAVDKIEERCAPLGIYSLSR
jgi:hypothetical protein